MAKTVLITGASSGIGKAAAALFSSRGWNVVATMRNPGAPAAESFAGIDNVFVTSLDVTDLQSISAAVQATLDKFGEIDVVVNNAGYGLAGPLELATPDQLQTQFATNVYGPVWMMQAVLPHFREKKKGVFINVTSVGGKVTAPFTSLYHGSKFALEGISECANYELGPLGIRVKILEPGGVQTDFAGRSMKMATSENITVYNEMLARTLQVYGTRGGLFSKPEDIALVIWEAATDGKNQVRYVAGEDAKEMLAARNKSTDEEYEKNKLEEFNVMGNATEP